MKAGAYSLDLYCDAKNPAHKHGEFPHQFVDELGSVCRAAARKAGWLISEKRDLCPKCNPRRQPTKDVNNANG